MNVFKRLKEKHPDIGFFYLFVAMLAAVTIAITLIFTLPRLFNLQKAIVNRRSKTISNSDISMTTELNGSGELVLTFENETFKFSSNSSFKQLGAVNSNTYIYRAYDTNPYYIDIDCTISGLSFKDLEFTLITSDSSGNNQVTVNNDDLTFAPKSSGGSIRYNSINETCIHSVSIAYTLK